MTFRVRPPDPHDLDFENDGIACRGGTSDAVIDPPEVLAGESVSVTVESGRFSRNFPAFVYLVAEDASFLELSEVTIPAEGDSFTFDVLLPGDAASGLYTIWVKSRAAGFGTGPAEGNFHAAIGEVFVRSVAVSPTPIAAPVSPAPIAAATPSPAAQPTRAAEGEELPASGSRATALALVSLLALLTGAAMIALESRIMPRIWWEVPGRQAPIRDVALWGNLFKRVGSTQGPPEQSHGC